MRDPNGHGTHVASIAAGRSVGDFAGGVAPEAKIAMVIAANQDYLGYSVSHIEALSYIDGLARRLGLPVVVNVSQGMNAGAHDGQSALEIAFDEFSRGGRTSGRVIVKSAGNERDKRAHAKITLPPNGTERLRWKRDPNASFPVERIELWWSSADDFEFRLEDPSGSRSKWLSNHSAIARQKGTTQFGNSYRMQHDKRHIDNGDSRLLLVIEPGAAKTIEPGSWTLLIRSNQVFKDGKIHAWIERGSHMPSSFTTHADPEITLSVPATATSVIAVGAIGLGKRPEVGHFSSYGPTRTGGEKPEVCAPGLQIVAAKSGTLDAVTPSDGTSMAAPHVSGAIALLLSRKPQLTANQIRSTLWQKTRDFNGRWDRGRGYGIIDVKQLLAAFP